MPKSSLPIVCICGSRSINYLNLDWYLDKNKIGQIVSGGANGVDTIAENWAKRNNIEFIAYLPQYEIYGGKYAPLKRDEDMVNYCDELVCFWDGKSNGSKYTYKKSYNKINQKYSRYCILPYIGNHYGIYQTN